LVERRQVAQRLLRLQYLWFNFRVDFLEPARWSARFPFVHGIAVPPLPEDYWDVENPFGVLTNIPLVWLALAVPLAWRNRSGQAASILRWFVTAAALLFGICALSVGFYRSAVIRYEVDFLPPLVLLAVVGILGLEHTLVGQPVRRRVVRWCWGVLLGFSTAFNLLASVQCYTYGRWTLGFALAQEGRASEAIQIYEEVLRLRPEFTEAHASLAHILQRTGKMPEAIAEYEKVVRLKPNYAEAHNDLGLALQQMGKIDEAITHYEQALRLKPDDADTHYNLGTALGQAGRLPEATSQYEQALRLKPDYADAHNNLGIALAQAGQLPGAIQEYEQAIRIEPDSAEAHYNLGKAFLQEGRLSDAIGQYEQALRINPDSAGAHYNLGRAFLQEGRFSDAIGQYEQVLRLKPDYAEAHNNLAWVLATAPPAQGGDPVRAVGLAQRACELSGNRVPGDLDTLAVAYAAVGRFDAAVATAQKAIDLARAVGQAELAQEIAARLELYRNGRAYSPSTGVTSPGNP
jgi:tetratricopeptide (TPR) repeat protein